MSNEKSIFLNDLNDKESKFNKLNMALNWEINMDFSFAYLNQNCREFLGIPPHVDINKKSLIDFIDCQIKDENSEGATFIQSIQSRLPVEDLRLKICSHDSQPRWVIAYASQDLENDTYIGKFVDVTTFVNKIQSHISNEKKYQSLLDTANDIIFTMDLHGNFNYISENIQKSLGYDPSSLKGQNALSIVHQEDIPIVNEMMQKLVEEPDNVSKKTLSYRVINHLGEVRWNETRGSLLRDEQSEVIGILGIARDITEIKRAERKILENQDLLHSTLEANLDAIYIFENCYSPEGKIVDFISKIVNHQATVQQDKPREELLGKSISDIFPTNIENGFFIKYSKVAKTGIPLMEEYFVPEDFPGQGWFQHQVVKIPDGIAINNKEITTQKNIQNELIKSEIEAISLARQYKDILTSRSIYVFKTDLDGFYTYSNDYFDKLFGPEEEIIGSDALSQIIEEDRQKYKDVVEKCFQKIGQSIPVILKRKNKFGEIKSGKWEIKVTPGEDGLITEVLCVGFDISEQIENLEKAQHLLEVSSEQNTRLKSFTYIVSHNIRSHVANMMGLLDVVKGEQSEEERSLFLQMLETSTNRLDETLRNLNEIISIQESTTKIKVEKNLKEELVKNLEILSGVIVKEDIQIGLEVSDNIKLLVIPSYLDSILLNLISNAIKYRNPTKKSVIIIKAFDFPDHLTIQISDNGLGIDLDKYGSKIFGMYKTFHNNSDARGFGLYITKNQVEAMGGKISVESEPGNGATFTLTFKKDKV